MSRFLVLGTGQQGSYIAKLIAGDMSMPVRNKVVIAGLDREEGNRIEKFKFGLTNQKITYQYFDASKCDSEHRHQLGLWFKSFDVVIGALPSHLGQAPIDLATEYGVNYVDLSFSMISPEDLQRLDTQAKITGCTVILDCGLAPGLPNMIVGKLLSELEPGSKLDDLKIYVGGVAADKTKSNGYVRTWSLEDLYEEYTRPARYVMNGVQREIMPLSRSNVERIYFKTPGNVNLEFEAFASDGLRSLLALKNLIPNMVEKTLRWPGHMDMMRSMLNKFGTDELNRTKEETVPIFKQMFALGGSSEENLDMVALMIKCGDANYSIFMKGSTECNAMTATTAGACASAAMSLASMLYQIRNNDITDVNVPCGVMPPETFYCDETRFRFLSNALKRCGVALNKV